MADLVAQSRLCIILVHAGLESVLVFLNHFPLFAIMLRIKDPERLPGGLKFRLTRRGQGSVLELSVSHFFSGRSDSDTCQEALSDHRHPPRPLRTTLYLSRL